MSFGHLSNLLLLDMVGRGGNSSDILNNKIHGKVWIPLETY